APGSPFSASSPAAATVVSDTSRPSTSRPSSSTAKTCTGRRDSTSSIHERSASTPPCASVAAARSVAMRDGGPPASSGGAASRWCCTHTVVPVMSAALTSASQKPMKIFQKSRPTLLLGEVVAEPAHGADHARAVAELLADRGEVHIDRAIEARERPAERLLRDLVLAHHAAGVADQHFQHVELDAGQRELAAAPLRAALFRPQRQRADLERPAVRAADVTSSL